MKHLFVNTICTAGCTKTSLKFNAFPMSTRHTVEQNLYCCEHKKLIPSGSL